MKEERIKLIEKDPLDEFTIANSKTCSSILTYLPATVIYEQTNVTYRSFIFISVQRQWWCIEK